MTEPMVTFLVERRYPDHLKYQCRDRNVPHYLPTRQLEQLDSEITAYEKLLRNLEPAFLAELYDRELKSVRPKKAERERRQLQVFNLEDDEAVADYTFWMKADVWTLEEAVALALGKCPGRLDAKVARARRKHVKLATDYLKLLDLAERAVKAADCNPKKDAKVYLSDPTTPMIFTTWLEENTHQCSDLFWNVTSGLRKTTHDDLTGRVRELESKIAELREANLRFSEERDFSQSMKKIILSLAIKHHRYHLRPDHNNATSSFSKGLHPKLAVSHNTIRDILKSAWAEFGPAVTAAEKKAI